MIRTGQQYLDSIRDQREVYINGERVKDVTRHPMFKPLVDIRARIYDMQHEAATRELLSYAQDGEWHAIANKLPRTQQDWWDKRRATDTVLEDIGGVVTRVGDETVGEMWSLFDGQDVLNEVDPQFSVNIRRHIQRVLESDPFHVSANTDPKGDRSKSPQEQDPDMLLHVVKETDAGIIVRGAKYETAAAYANQAFTKPTIANWGNAALSDYAVGFVCDLSSPNLKFICRTGFAGRAPEGPTVAEGIAIAEPPRAAQILAAVTGPPLLVGEEEIAVAQRHLGGCGIDVEPTAAAAWAAWARDGAALERPGPVVVLLGGAGAKSRRAA